MSEVRIGQRSDNRLHLASLSAEYPKAADWLSIGQLRALNSSAFT